MCERAGGERSEGKQVGELVVLGDAALLEAVLVVDDVALVEAVEAGQARATVVLRRVEAVRLAEVATEISLVALALLCGVSAGQASRFVRS